MGWFSIRSQVAPVQGFYIYIYATPYENVRTVQTYKYRSSLMISNQMYMSYVRPFAHFFQISSELSLRKT